MINDGDFFVLSQSDFLDLLMRRGIYC
jgi:hypothetical protein